MLSIKLKKCALNKTDDKGPRRKIIFLMILNNILYHIYDLCNHDNINIKIVVDFNINYDDDAHLNN